LSFILGEGKNSDGTSDNFQTKFWILMKLLLKFPADFQARLFLSILQRWCHRLPRNPSHVQFL
jgi:hypothetical protein